MKQINLKFFLPVTSVTGLLSWIYREEEKATQKRLHLFPMQALYYVCMSLPILLL